MGWIASSHVYPVVLNISTRIHLKLNVCNHGYFLPPVATITFYYPLAKTARTLARSDFTGGALRPGAADHQTADGLAMGDTSLSVPETSMSIRELKQELGRRGIDCGSCVEKRELVQLLHDASAPASKRARPTPSSSALAPSTTTTTTTCTVPCEHEAAAIRRLRAALPRSFLPKEPDPERLFEAHGAPPLYGEAHLRIATWNLLDTVTGPNDPRGIHAVFDVRRINVLRLLLALDADVVILQELCKARGLG